MEISDAAGDLVNTCGHFGDGVSYQTQELRPQGKLYLRIYRMISFNLTVFNQQVCKAGHLYPAKRSDGFAHKRCVCRWSFIS